MIREAIAKLVEGKPITGHEALLTMRQIMGGEATPAQIAAYLVALRMVGETPEVIAGSANAMREHFTVVEPHANVLVMRDAVIQRSARVGQGTVCRGRSLVSHDTTVGQYCYIGFGAMILGNTVVEDHCFIGAGAIVRDGVRVAKGSVIGAGAVIMSDTVPNGVYACAETELREVHRVL